MRRVLLGGLGIALGVMVRPAAAQDYPSFPAAIPTETQPASRAARLGVPVAIPDSPSDVTPAGLFARRPLAPAAVPGSPPTTLAGPVFVAGPPGVPVAGVPLGTPRPLGGAPSLTEIRGPVVGGLPVGPGASGVPLGAPMLAPGEVLVPPAGTGFVPAPVAAAPGAVYPAPVPDAPIYGAPRVPGMQRLFGLGCNDRWWLGAEYLTWWTKATQLPPLVTTSSPAFNGIPGTGDTQTVLGGSFGDTLHGGARFSTGWWFSDDQCRGVDARFLFLFRNGNGDVATTATYPLLARPFFNANAPVGPFSEIVGAPGLAVGGVATNLENSLWGAEVNYRRYLCGNPCGRLDWLAGFRYMNFTETLTISETFLRTPDSPLTVGAPALSGTITDRFRAENNFYGGQVGLAGELRRGRWFVNGRATVAFGTVHQTAEIAGGQTLVLASGVAQAPGGLLALPGANMGRYSENKFAVMPEAGLNFGYHITPHCRVFMGYNFLYLSSVLRAGGTIDSVVDAARIPNFPLPGNPAPLPGTPRPAPQFNTTDFWAQGINFGLQWTW